MKTVIAVLALVCSVSAHAQWTVKPMENKAGGFTISTVSILNAQTRLSFDFLPNRSCMPVAIYYLLGIDPGNLKTSQIHLESRIDYGERVTNSALYLVSENSITVLWNFDNPFQELQEGHVLYLQPAPNHEAFKLRYDAFNLKDAWPNFIDAYERCREAGQTTQKPTE